jgi:phenylpropionate dioxygenase-like ring-hydroxylating dioxygenase large terminal subunit
MFLKNTWYVAATAQELGRELIGRWICEEPLVLYRREDGAPVALEDRCPHRKFALSKGQLVGDEVQCGYHGMKFDCTGACTFVPGQDNIPPRLKARVYPVVEKHCWVWVWMGDPADADESLIPDYHWNQAAGWAPVMGYLNFQANYQLVTDNLLDLTHETFVHQGTIGNQAVAHTPMKTRSEGDTVSIERVMEDCDPPPLFKRCRGFTTNIDRWQRIRFEPPAHIWIDAGGVPTGTEMDPVTNDMALNWMVLNALTPERDGSTHYFWSVSRRFNLDDEELDGLLSQQIVNTFEEDRDVLETQQELIETDQSGRPLLAVNCDAGNAAARKIMDKLIQAEAPA